MVNTTSVGRFTPILSKDDMSVDSSDKILAAIWRNRLLWVDWQNITICLKTPQYGTFFHWRSWRWGWGGWSWPWPASQQCCSYNNNNNIKNNNYFNNFVMNVFICLFFNLVLRYFPVRDKIATNIQTKHFKWWHFLKHLTAACILDIFL